MGRAADHVKVFARRQSLHADLVRVSRVSRQYLGARQYGRERGTRRRRILRKTFDLATQRRQKRQKLVRPRAGLLEKSRSGTPPPPPPPPSTLSPSRSSSCASHI